MVAQSAMKLENANYERVTLVMEHILLEYPQFCKCTRCRMDLMAIALNNLPPKYFVAPLPTNIEDLASSWFTVEVAVRKALNRVLRYPHHNPHHNKDIPTERSHSCYHHRE